MVSDSAWIHRPPLVPRKDDVDVYNKFDLVALKTEMMKKAEEVFAGRWTIEKLKDWKIPMVPGTS